MMKLCAQALSEFQSEREGVEQYIHRFLKSFQALVSCVKFFRN